MEPSGDNGLAAGLLDLGLGRLGELRRGDLQRAGDFAVAQHLEVLLVLADEAGLGEDGDVDVLDLGVEGREVADVDDHGLGAEVELVEAAVRELAVKGHLAALKARADGAAGTGRLALAATAAGLAVAAALAAADALLP